MANNVNGTNKISLYTLLMQLPGELRNQIYREVVPIGRELVPVNNQGANTKEDPNTYLAIFRVNRRLSEEAHSLFLHLNTFFVSRVDLCTLGLTPTNADNILAFASKLPACKKLIVTCPEYGDLFHMNIWFRYGPHRYFTPYGISYQSNQVGLIDIIGLRLRMQLWVPTIKAAWEGAAAGLPLPEPPMDNNLALSVNFVQLILELLQDQANVDGDIPAGYLDFFDDTVDGEENGCRKLTLKRRGPSRMADFTFFLAGAVHPNVGNTDTVLALPGFTSQDTRIWDFYEGMPDVTRRPDFGRIEELDPTTESEPAGDSEPTPD